MDMGMLWPRAGGAAESPPVARLDAAGGHSARDEGAGPRPAPRQHLHPSEAQRQGEIRGRRRLPIRAGRDAAAAPRGADGRAASRLRACAAPASLGACVCAACAHVWAASVGRPEPAGAALSPAAPCRAPYNRPPPHAAYYTHGLTCAARLAGASFGRLPLPPGRASAAIGPRRCCQRDRPRAATRLPRLPYRRHRRRRRRELHATPRHLACVQRPPRRLAAPLPHARAAAAAAARRRASRAVGLADGGSCQRGYSCLQRGGRRAAVAGADGRLPAGLRAHPRRAEGIAAA
eukprot:scaffold9986_cov58-Phaeocystis_antarctica.AAC.1